MAKMMESPIPFRTSASEFSSMSSTQLRRATSRSGLRTNGIPMRPAYLSRHDAGSVLPSIEPEAHAPLGSRRERKFDETDSSDDELPMPMKFSALTKALLEGEGSIIASSPSGGSADASAGTKTTKYNLSGSTAVASDKDRIERREQRKSMEPPSDFPNFRTSQHSRGTPEAGRAVSPYPRRVVRLSVSPKEVKYRRNSSLSRSKLGHGEVEEEAPPNSEVSTPAPTPRTIRIPVTATTKPRTSFGSAGRASSAQRELEHNARSDPDITNEEPATVAKPYNITSAMGSVTRYGQGGIMRSRYGGGLASMDETGPQSSLRFKRVAKVPGSFLSGPARRGKRRQSEEDEAAEREAGLQSAYSSPKRDIEEEQPEGQEHAFASSQGASSQDLNVPKSSFYAASQFQDFAAAPTSSPIVAAPRAARGVSPPLLLRQPLAEFKPLPRHEPISRREAREPTPPALTEFKPLPRHDPPARRSATPPEPAPAQQPLAQRLARSEAIAQPIFRRPEIPSARDQENEAPPLLKRLNPVSALDLHKLDGIPLKPRVAVLEPPRSQSPPRREPLAARSQNTPRRPAPPPPKMAGIEKELVAPTPAPREREREHREHREKKRNAVRVNGKTFQRMEIVGRGGSSKVWRVMGENGKVYALKRVSMEDADETAVRGYKGEIDLLRKMAGNERVVQLWEFEMNEEKQMLSVLMEMGELDFNKILSHKFATAAEPTFDPSFTRHYWREMLLCIQAVHAHDIVHSDLKPANFVLCQGKLKLIDFGIANKIETDETVNVHRDTQIGTPNYMSPESLMDSSELPENKEEGGEKRGGGKERVMKLGKPSDVWSLGVILYQMTYGVQPFAHIANQMSRCRAIIDWNYEIKFPDRGMGDVKLPQSLIDTMKGCLQRDQRLRPTVESMLSREDRFLWPREVKRDEVVVSKELLGRIMWASIDKAKHAGREVLEPEVMGVWAPKFWEQAKKMNEEAEGA